jgi:hypothetical protein
MYNYLDTMTLVLMLRNRVKRTLCIVLRENYMLKATQEYTVATQKSDCILAQLRTISFIPLVEYLKYTTGTFQYMHYTGIPI